MTEVAKWVEVWRKGIAPQLSTEGLGALKAALAADDERLIQGATTTPPPLQWVQDWPVEAACLIGFCGAVDGGGLGVATIAATEEFFARVCFVADQVLGEPAACRWFLNFWDETPRDEMRRLLLPEVNAELRRR